MPNGMSGGVGVGGGQLPPTTRSPGMARGREHHVMGYGGFDPAMSYDEGLFCICVRSCYNVAAAKRGPFR